MKETDMTTTPRTTEVEKDTPLPCPLCGVNLVTTYEETSATHMRLAGYAHTPQDVSNKCALRWWVLPLRDVAAWNSRPAPAADGRVEMREALRGLVDAVSNMRVPQTVADVGLQVFVTLGPALDRARSALASREGKKEEGWRDIATAPKDGHTVEVRAVMRAHYMEGCRFALMPEDWRPDTPQTSWRMTGWREVESVAAGRDGCGSEQRERVATPLPSPPVKP